MGRFNHGCVAALLTVTAALSTASVCAADGPAPGGYHVVRTMPIGGKGRWDYVAVDPIAKLLYMPRQSHMQVIREETGEVVGDLQGTPGIHGVALVPEAGYGFTSNGKAASLTCFDLKTLHAQHTVFAGDNPDAILYDPASKLVMAFNGESHDVSGFAAADVGTSKAHPRPALALSGKPEFAAADGYGNVYVNIEDKNVIAVIDTKAWKVTAEWKIIGGDSPSGLAIDVAGHRLFSGCHNQVMAVLDTTNGKTIGLVPIGKGVDACAFDPGTGEAFASCGDGTLTVAKETSAGKFEVTQTVKTRRGARTMGLDPKTHAIYLPTAEFVEPESDNGSRPTAKPGTFMIVVVAR